MLNALQPDALQNFVTIILCH